MSSAGSIADMITRSNYLRGLRNGTYQNRKARMRQMYVESLSRSGIGLADEVAPEVLAKVREEIRETMLVEKRRNIIIATTVTILVAALVIFVSVLVLTRRMPY